MTQKHVPLMPRTEPHPVRMYPAGLSNRETRDRLECLRIAADAGGTPDQVLARAQGMLSYIEAAADDYVRGNRWHCLRMASQMSQPPECGDDFVTMAKAFEAFVYAPTAQARA